VNENDATRRRLERCGCPECSAFLLRLSDLARNGVDRGAASLRSEEGPGFTAAGDTSPPDRPGPSTSRAFPPGAAPPERHVPPRARSGNFAKNGE
jgi:hypothetical protein